MSKKSRIHPYENPTAKKRLPKNVPLADQLLADNSVKQNGRQKIKQNRRHDDEDDEYASSNLTKKILQQAHKQQKEEEDDGEDHWPTLGSSEKKSGPIVAFSKRVVVQPDDDLESENEEAEDKEHQEDFSKNVEVDAEDILALERFMPENPAGRRTIGDILSEKLTEKRTALAVEFGDDASSVQPCTISEEHLKVYVQLPSILMNYRSGKLPAPFKLIPKQQNWEEILQVTRPGTWSAATMYQATRMFVSNLSRDMAQRFINLILLPRVRDHIDEYKKLNSHLYQAVRKALFKSGAFMKGFLIPLLESGSCTLQEATIVASVLSKASIPWENSMWAMLKIAEMEYGGPNSIFLRTLLEKKYALPCQCIDAVVFHFLGFRTDKRVLPVLWHQCLLSFVVHYKNQISSEQKSALIALLRVHEHVSITSGNSITQEIRRELLSAVSPDEVGTAAVEPDITDRFRRGSEPNGAELDEMEIPDCESMDDEGSFESGSDDDSN